jgi:hypothetical protein
VLKFNPGIGSGELPVYRGFLAVSPGSPGCYFITHLFYPRYPPVKALAAQNANFQFRHIKPGTVFRRMVDFKTFG